MPIPAANPTDLHLIASPAELAAAEVARQITEHAAARGWRVNAYTARVSRDGMPHDAARVLVARGAAQIKAEEVEGGWTIEARDRKARTARDLEVSDAQVAQAVLAEMRRLDG